VSIAVDGGIIGIEEMKSTLSLDIYDTYAYYGFFISLEWDMIAEKYKKW